MENQIKELLKSIENDVADLKDLIEQSKNERESFFDALTSFKEEEENCKHKDDDKI